MYSKLRRLGLYEPMSSAVITPSKRTPSRRAVCEKLSLSTFDRTYSL